jgi:hypothetical protein
LKKIKLLGETDNGGQKMGIVTDRRSGIFEVITVGSTATAFTSTNISPTTGAFVGKTCREVFCTLEGDQIRFTLDGTDPANGHLLNVGDTLSLNNPDDIKNFQAIRVTADATMRVSYKF